MKTVWTRLGPGRNMSSKDGIGKAGTKYAGLSLEHGVGLLHMVTLGVCLMMFCLQTFHSYVAYAEQHFVQIVSNTRIDQVQFPMLVICDYQPFQGLEGGEGLHEIKTGARRGQFV